MANNFSYQSDDYDRETQRFVIPLYIKDNLGNYDYSSTGTLVKYNDHHYVIFSAHALNNNNQINNMYFFYTDGSFQKILNFSIGYKIYNEEDIAIIDYFNNEFTRKNYFNLNIKNLSGFNKKYFAWTGFPISKAKNVHNTKQKETLKKNYISSNKDGTYYKIAKYFTIISKIEYQNKNFIKGRYNRENITLKYQGAITKGVSPKGMSGGAMYFFTKSQNLKDTLDETFRFAGIGIKYENERTIVGVFRDKVVELIDLFNEKNPIQIIPSGSHL